MVGRVRLSCGAWMGGQTRTQPASACAAAAAAAAAPAAAAAAARPPAPLSSPPHRPAHTGSPLAERNSSSLARASLPPRCAACGCEARVRTWGGEATKGSMLPARCAPQPRAGCGWASGAAVPPCCLPRPSILQPRQLNLTMPRAPHLRQLGLLAVQALLLGGGPRRRLARRLRGASGLGQRAGRGSADACCTSAAARQWAPLAGRQAGPSRRFPEASTRRPPSALATKRACACFSRPEVSGAACATTRSACAAWSASGPGRGVP